MVILNDRAEIRDFLNVRTQKYVRSKGPYNAILAPFWHKNLLEF